MKYKTAFRLAVRLVGVFLAAQWVPSFAAGLASVAQTLIFGGGLLMPDTWILVTLIQSGLGIAIALYLFFRGEWIVNLAVPSNRPYCHECGYELTGLPADGQCPECGTEYRRPTRDGEEAVNEP